MPDIFLRAWAIITSAFMGVGAVLVGVAAIIFAMKRTEPEPMYPPPPPSYNYDYRTPNPPWIKNPYYQPIPNRPNGSLGNIEKKEEAK